MKYTCMLLFVAAIASYYASNPLRFDNFQVHRVIPATPSQLEALKQIEQDSSGFSFWTEVTEVGHAVDIMVPPHLKYNFEDLINLQKLDSRVWIENVQELIDNEKPATGKQSSNFDWDDYQTLNRIYAWFQSLASAYPRVVTMIEGGRSYEGRSIMGVKVSFKSGNKGVFLEGGIHAREWIAPATVTCITNQLLSSKDPNVRAVVESRDCYIFPVVNPDGYVYTHTHDRLWRKTRKPYGSCIGADPNRNWGYHWMAGGASKNPCLETHAGSSAFSEIETKSLSEFISSVVSNLDVCLAFHSYSQLLLIPFGHSGLAKAT